MPMNRFAVPAKYNSVKSRVFAILAIFAWAEPAMTEAGSLDLSTARLAIDDRGIVTGLVFGDGSQWPSAPQPAFSIEAGGRTYLPKACQRIPPRLQITEPDDPGKESAHEPARLTAGVY